MSDNIQDIAKRFEENVLRSGHPRSFGLFPIPEYPELEADQGMWSAAFDAILTTLRYLAPATLLTLFWGQQSFLFKLLKGIDSAFRAIVFSSEEQKQEVLQWLAVAGPVRVEHLETVWRHGWILCGVLDAALPGACTGHAPTRLSLKHAQTIADHYLGVEPVFSRKELESNDALSRHQEWKLATYIDRIRKALEKLTPPVSKPTSQRTSPETNQVTFDYVARGSGLAAAQVNNKMYFKLYPTSQQSLDPGEITILIRGPKDTYGMTVLPPVLGKAQLIRHKLLGLQQKTTFTETALPLTQGATYMRTFGKNDMNKTYHIPKEAYDIQIEVEQREDHAKISYIVALEGKHEISITSRGQNIVGSPFPVSSSKNIIGTLEKESFCLEDGEEINIVDIKTDRKVVLRIVDFISEKMLLRENGSFEKITDEEANILMSMEYISGETSDQESRTCSVASSRCDDTNIHKFNKMASKVVQMNRVCKIINSLLAEKKKREKAFIRPKSQQSIPDIVNSTFSDTNINPLLGKETRDKVIVPENISVSLRTEKTKQHHEKEMSKNIEDDENIYHTSIEIDLPDSLEKYESIPEDHFLTNIPNSASNPFLNHHQQHIHIPQNYKIEKDLGSFVKTEYETNKSDNEETETAPIKILIETIDNSQTPSPINITNPFVEPDIIMMERPKTPILKIISGEIQNRDDSVFVNPKVEELFSDEMLANEFVNPFFIHHHQQNQERLPVTDFIIGAPVSLPPIVRASTPEPNMDSILITDEFKSDTKENDERVDEEPSSSVFSTPLHTTLIKFKETQKVDKNTSSSLFYSLDSNGTDNVEILSLSNPTHSSEPYQQLRSERDVTPKKDTWDSAYVSIDDSNSSPDSNNNENNTISENSCKQKFSLSDIEYQYKNMGPAEREIWESCNELTETKIFEEAKPKWDTKRPIFTPILEESDRSISTGMKDAIRSESGSNAVAFAELNGDYRNSFSKYIEDSRAINKHKDFERNDKSVNSASALSDVKRHAEDLEGKISEVQANVTESVSVSQTLHKYEHKHLKYSDQNKEETQFGDENRSNIVLEKKQYWDERIREIQAKSSEEDKTQQKRKRLSARHLRQNDSLTKRRGKQAVKNFLNSGKQWETKDKTEIKDIEIVNRKSPLSHDSPDKATDVKLVEKWKNYWDCKLQSDKEETETSCFRTKSPKSKESSMSPQLMQYSSDDLIEEYEPIGNKIKSSPKPTKQELPEEVFKAFETSPKRFFGTSRKQILNKIDTFLGKPGTADESSPELSGAGNEYDTGLVSSRISLFHTISKTEVLPWTPRKCQSMHNIFQRKDSERSIPSVKEDVEDTLIKNDCISNTDPRKPGLERKYVTIDAEEISKHLEKEPKGISLKEKRARLVQNVHHKTFDETSYKKVPQWHNTVGVQISSVKKSVNEYNKYSDHRQKYRNMNVLRKSSVSKSEMDIFSKITNKPVEDDLDKHKSYDELPKINVKSFISLYESVSKDVKKPGKQISKTRGMGLQSLSLSSSSTGAVNNLGSTYNTKNFDKPTSETDESTTDMTQSSANQWNKDPDGISSGSYEPRSLDSVDVEIVPLKNSKNTTYVSLSDIELEIVENGDKLAETLQPKKGEVEVNSTDYKSRFKMAKQFFQSLEDVTEVKKPKKLNECEKLLLSESSESLENEKEPIRPPRRVKKNIKSHSMPSSEISKIWNQLKESQDNNKLVKISEKFNVDDLFNDVMEGRLSRQGSLKGIPHKKAVLETFRSMENLTNRKISSYEIAATQLTDFAKENHIKNAQTYLTEYPYLPTTAPSKYHSRLDAKATGLISLKELHNQKPRRNSVPDLRLNPSFAVQL